MLVQRRRDKAAAVKQAAQETGLRARCAGDRQTAFLRRSEVRNRFVGSPRTGLTHEQSGREFASTGSPTRAQDAAVQIARIGPTLLVRSRRRPQHFQRSTPSHIPPHAPDPPNGSFPHLASRHCGLSPKSGFPIFVRPNSVRVTAPSEVLGEEPCRDAVPAGRSEGQEAVQAPRARRSSKRQSTRILKREGGHARPARDWAAWASDGPSEGLCPAFPARPAAFGRRMTGRWQTTANSA